MRLKVNNIKQVTASFIDAVTYFLYASIKLDFFHTTLKFAYLILLTIYGDNVKVIEPTNLIEKMKEHLAKVVNLYD